MRRRTIIVTAISLLLTIPVFAEIVSLDDPVFGASSITLDDETGFEWLDLTKTQNRSVADVAAQLGPGGEFQGFSYATSTDIFQLFTNAGIPNIVADPNTIYLYPENVPSVPDLMEKWGVTYPLGVGQILGSQAFLADGPIEGTYWHSILYHNPTFNSASASTRGSSGSDIEAHEFVGHALVRKPPKVVSVSPSPGAIDVPLLKPDLIMIQFDQPMNKESVLNAISFNFPMRWKEYHAWPNDSTLVFLPEINWRIPFFSFPESAFIEITISTDAANLAGKRLETPYQWSFQTRSKVVSSDNVKQMMSEAYQEYFGLSVPDPSYYFNRAPDYPFYWTSVAYLNDTVYRIYLLEDGFVLHWQMGSYFKPRGIFRVALVAIDYGNTNIASVLDSQWVDAQNSINTALAEFSEGQGYDQPIVQFENVNVLAQRSEIEDPSSLTCIKSFLADKGYSPSDYDIFASLDLDAANSRGGIAYDNFTRVGWYWSATSFATLTPQFLLGIAQTLYNHEIGHMFGWDHYWTIDYDLDYPNQITHPILYGWLDTDGDGVPEIMDLTPYGMREHRFSSFGDIDGDGKPDVLWRHAETGENYVWYLDGVTVLGGGVLPTVTDQNWKVVGVEDFNHDDRSDILWRHSATGDNYVWYLDGVTVLGGGVLPPVADQNWKVVGVADFNNDDRPDILWRHAATGDNYIWYLDGVAVLGGGVLPTVTDQNWKVVGVADFNNDDKPDILWRHAQTGDNYVWYLDGVAVQGGGVLPTVTDQDWNIVGTADFNSDANPDVLWRHAATGDNYVWYLDGVAVLAGGVLPTVTDQNWTIVP